MIERILKIGEKKKPHYLEHEFTVISANKYHLPREPMANASAAHQEPRSHAHFGAWHLTFIHPKHKKKSTRQGELLMKCANTKVCSLCCQISLYHGTKRCLTHLCSCLKSLVTTSSCEVSARTCYPCAMCRSSAAWKYTYSKVRLRV